MERVPTEKGRGCFPRPLFFARSLLAAGAGAGPTAAPGIAAPGSASAGRFFSHGSLLRGSRPASPIYSSVPTGPTPRCFGYSARVLRVLAGHFLSLYEQNTQQSPALGMTTTLQPGHSQKYWQASSGISARLSTPHSGHRIVAVSVMAAGIVAPRGALGHGQNLPATDPLRPTFRCASGTYSCY